MKIRKFTHLILPLILLGAASGLKAQEGNSPWSYLIKFRVGLTAGDLQETHFDNKIMGFAAGIKREMFANGGALTAEVAWEYVPGRHHDIYPWDKNPLGLNPRYSYDNRKENGQGINLRFAYSTPMPQMFGDTINNFAKDVEWFAGISIDRFKVFSEVKYTLNFTPNTQNPGIGLYDGGTFTKEGSNFAPGFFAGLRYSYTDELGFELSFRNFGMYHLDFTPVAYSYTNNPTRDPADYGVAKGQSKDGTSRGWALEFAVTAKF